ncbi:phage portal protein [Streptomonospora wellingtoniae]|uniref:Phage portal protein n=1 Tax=Streptomonospora wellingtoniae TaxID=3075544 RepID=A0ABU2KUI3_9ACTN|nr:phage portal protein [Streptomonospora sp. DSM 45055]MDT0302910.1 phage portal protein [Streptomonospora sp. DSM 45055]
MAEPTDLSPFEWLARLGPKLVERRPKIDYWRRYYEGHHDLPAGPSQHKEAFMRFQKKARTNLCKLAAESMVHRMRVVGYRDAGSRSQTDNPVWRLWQQARMDARQFGLWRKASHLGSSYLIVGVDPRDSSRPLVTIEGPDTVIVECDPADPMRRLAALRLWHDSIANRWMATVYLPGQRHHWQSAKETKKASGRISWRPEAWRKRDLPTRSLPEVPVIPFVNADEGEEGAAEFDVGIDVQDRLNLTLLNRLSAERYAAYRQNALLNYVPDEDPVTGEKLAPWKPGTDQIWTVPPGEPGDPEPKMVSLPQTDTSQMLQAVEADMRAFAAVTLTPVYYLPGDLINISADSVAALDAGHVSKIEQRHAQYGEGLEEALSLMAHVAGLDLDLSSSEVVWARPENFNPAQMADYATKLRGAGYPLPIVAERIGDTPQQVAQLRSEMAADSIRTRLSGAGQRQAAPGGASADTRGEQLELGSGEQE